LTCRRQITGLAVEGKVSGGKSTEKKRKGLKIPKKVAVKKGGVVNLRQVRRPRTAIREEKKAVHGIRHTEKDQEEKKVCEMAIS